MNSQWRNIIPLTILVSSMFPINQITGSSMEPTLNNKNIIISTIFFNISRGDIVNIKSHNKPALYCKRIVGLSGDIMNSSRGPITVPKGHCWIEGDSIDSIDSRKHGPMPIGLIESKVLFVVYPFSTMKTVSNVDFKSQRVGIETDPANLEAKLWRRDYLLV